MTPSANIRKALASGGFSGIVFIGFLLLAGFIHTTEGVAAITLTPDLSVSASAEITTTSSVYLPVVRVTDRTVANMGFENGPEAWTEYSTHEQELILSAAGLPTTPHSGQWAARLGGVNNEISMISQAISIQAGNSCLTYQVWVQSSDNCNADFGGVGVNGHWQAVESLCAGTATGRWVARRVKMGDHVTTPMTPTIVLNFAASTDYSVASTMLIDDIVFAGESSCDDSVRVDRHSEIAGQRIGQQIMDEIDR